MAVRHSSGSVMARPGPSLQYVTVAGSSSARVMSTVCGRWQELIGAEAAHVAALICSTEAPLAGKQVGQQRQGAPEEGLRSCSARREWARCLGRLQHGRGTIVWAHLR